MSQRELTKAELVVFFGESSKQIERYVAQGMPCSGKPHARRFPWPEVRNWRDERVRRLEREEVERKLKPATEDEVKLARERRFIAESKLLEIELAEREGKLVTLEQLETVVGDLGDRIRAVLINLPSNFLLNLERAGLTPERGQEVLEEIAEALTVALRGVADEIESDDGDDLAA